MKKATVISIILLASLIAGGAFLFKDVIRAVFFDEDVNKKIITLINGTIIEADTAWESGGIFFYEIDGESYLLNKEEIKSIGKIDYKYHLAQVRNKTANAAGAILSKLKYITNSNTSSANRHLLLVIFILGTTLICIFFLFLLRQFTGNMKARRPAEVQPAPVQDENDEISRLDIARHFLELFKLQIGAPADAPVKMAPLSSKSSGPNYIYELRVMDRGEWVKRRMTIGPIGEDTGSKSKCFYVIYDVHLVIKIPTRPISNFEQYIANIKKEGKIVEKLAPKECVIPKVSVILNLIHKFPDNDPIPAETLEEKYIHWLRKNTHYQEYLKIKNTFIFFMDFSRFYFLGHIIDGLHDLKDAIPTEIMENSETIWDPSKFKGRYGKKNESVSYEILEVYDQCELEIHKFLAATNVSSSVPLYRIQNWFLTHLTGKRITAKEGGLPDPMIQTLNQLIAKILSTNKQAVDAYIKIIREYVYTIRLEQDKPQMSGIITNLVELLAWLEEKQVSLRDLKPDNLLVAGDPSKYPRFLMSADDYSLGIIDVETAVDFEISKYNKTKQPLLGGTPFYATPSHFFKNETLTLCFPNFRKILHLQDWHAMAVMIFKVVTGGILFEQTARLFGHIRERIKNSYADAEGQAEVMKTVSQMFWRSASIEFQLKIGDTEEALKTVKAAIPENAQRLFLRLLTEDQKFTAKRMQRLIGLQPAFKSEKSRELLYKSSPAKIFQFKKHLERKFKTASPSAFDMDHVLKFIDDLIRLKIYSDRQRQIKGILNQPKPSLSAHDLLCFMFHTVYHAMFKEDWQVAPKRDMGVTGNLDDEATTLEASDS